MKKNKIEYCLEMIEYERGFGQRSWTNRYKTERARQKAMDAIKDEDRSRPAQATYINFGKQWIEINGKK